MKAKEQDIIVNSSIAAEELRIKGYSIVEDVLSSEQISEASRKLDELMRVQEQEVGKEKLYDAAEDNIVRLPLAYDEFFVWTFLNNPVVKNVVSELLGSYHQLHSQNGILIQSHGHSHFAGWHRNIQFDSKPTSVTALFCLQDISRNLGGPVVLPFSHRQKKLPSQEYIRLNQVPLQASAGSLILMDSLLYHCAGSNNGIDPRRSIRQVYTNIAYKQEIDIPAALDNRFSGDPYFNMLLGYSNRVAASVKEFRLRKIKKVHH